MVRLSTMFRARKSFVVALLLVLSGCGEPDRPRPSVVAPQAEPSKAAQVKDEPKVPAPVTPSATNPPAHPWNYNYALATNGGSAAGCDKPGILIDGNSTNYDGAEGYAATDWSVKPPGAMLITLKDSVEINTVRFLLWDGDPRYYQFRLEASSDAEGDQWRLLSDCTTGEFRGWQLLSIPTQKIRRFRLTGTFNSANNYFHVVEFQAFNIPAGFTPRWNEPADKPAAVNTIGASKDDF